MCATHILCRCCVGVINVMQIHELSEGPERDELKKMMSSIKLAVQLEENRNVNESREL